MLLVEGEYPVGEGFSEVLSIEDLFVVTARTRDEALDKMAIVDPALVVLDATSVQFGALHFCEVLHKDGCRAPIMMLLDEDIDERPDVGVESYLHHSVDSPALITQVTRLLQDAEEEQVLRAGDVHFNLDRQYVSCRNCEAHLTPKQATLLETFMRHPNELLTRKYLMKEVWETDYVGDTRTLDVHIHWLRRAIEEDTHTPTHIRTVRGKGYRFHVPEMGQSTEEPDR